MKKLITLLLAICCGPFLVPAQDYWQQQVDYTINVSLQDKDHSLDGFEKMIYTNHSPDTLSFIWIHCWPNAYKNDRTAFSEQLLENGRTDFYFSGKEAKGYINHLDFRIDGIVARTEDHPRYIDIVRIFLPHPLPPGGQITITTPFHVRLPVNFSRGGYMISPGSHDATYQVTQWYPKPAVYDREGWHPIPYLDQGEFYSEFGNYDVRITVPNDFIIAATGELQNAPGHQETTPSQGPGTKTLRYLQNNIHDFAWFANRHFQTDHDTLQLTSGRIIDVYAFYTPASRRTWQHSTQYMKDAIRFRSTLIGEYPFNVVTAVEAGMGNSGGMEYPTITAINMHGASRDLDITLEHEIGHNWFYGILGTNERRYPWMDEGINTYYDNRYTATKYTSPHPELVLSPPGSHHHPRHANNDWLLMKIPDNQEGLFINTLARKKKDQPISTSSEDFTVQNYDLIAYAKTGIWMRRLEDSLGTPLFDSCMRQYFRSWQFRHPYPNDFKRVFDSTSHRDMSSLFARLDEKGPATPFPTHRTIRPTFLFSARHTDRYDYINLIPAVGYNKYDGFMAGGLIHNLNLPPDPFQFILAPLYATNSHQLNGIGHLSYRWYPAETARFRKIEIGVGGGRFSTLSGIDTNDHKIFGGFYKITPSLRLTFRNTSPRSTGENWIEWKTYLIGEKGFDNYMLKTTDSLYYPVAGKYHFRYLNQLTLNIQDNRVLYPYKACLQLQQGASFYRINLTGNYFFNYAGGGGMAVRVFGAKFGYIGRKDLSQDLTMFEPKLTAIRGNEDYTYSNYFFGRNEFDGFASQQVMMRDGDLKLRTDLFQGLQGRSDNWVASANFTTTLPTNIIPEWLPLKVFFDVGTYAAGWQDNPPTSRFLYVGGLELSLLHNVVRFYAPLVYSHDFSNQLKTVPDQNSFWKKLSFSIDLQNVNFRKILGNIPL